MGGALASGFPNAELHHHSGPDQAGRSVQVPEAQRSRLIAQPVE
jgi:hypothetical protein